MNPSPLSPPQTLEVPPPNNRRRGRLSRSFRSSINKEEFPHKPKKQGSIRKLFGCSTDNKQKSTLGTMRKASSFDCLRRKSLSLRRTKSLSLSRTKSLQEGAVSRRSIGRQNSFDLSVAKRQAKSSRRQCASRKRRRVRFCDEVSAIDSEESSSSNRSTSWYSKEELKALLDHEIHITVRSQGTVTHSQCCSRGIEQQLAGEDKAPKIQTYVQTILKAEAEIRKRNNDANASEELLMISQILTKEDRARAYKMGFKDASEVQIINLQ